MHIKNCRVGPLDTSQNMLRVSELRCERDERVLFSELTLDFGRSELVQIKGANGAGKTTLLRILAGLYSYYEGAVSSNGQNILENLSAHHQSLFFMSHKTSVKSALTARENLVYLCGIAGFSPSVVVIDEALAEIGMRGYEDVVCSEMSAGQQRRVVLASLLISNAPILMLDEPFTSLDVAGVAQLEALLLKKAQAGALVIFTSHHRVEVDGVRSIELSELASVKQGDAR